MASTLSPNDNHDDEISDDGPSPGSRRRSVYGETCDDPFKVPIRNIPKSPPQITRVTKCVGFAKDAVFFMSKMTKNQLNQMIKAMQETQVKNGDVIITQGEEGDNFYIIESGTYDVMKKMPSGNIEKVFTYNDKGSFGELALLHNDKRQATVIAKSAGTIWAIDRQSFRGIMMSAEAATKNLYESFLKNVSILSELTDDQIRKVSDALLPMNFNKDTAIVKEGETADGMYFVEEGDLVVTCTAGSPDAAKSGRKSSAENQVELKHLKKGDYFGEAALLNNDKRSATVKSTTEVHLCKLDKAAFERLLGPCMNLMKKEVKKYKKEREDAVHRASKSK